MNKTAKDYQQEILALKEELDFFQSQAKPSIYNHDTWVNDEPIEPKTAAEILEMHFGSDFWILEKYEFKIHILNAMNEYAKDQIKKDRDRVKKHAKVACVIQGNQIDTSSYVKSDGDSFKVSTKSIDQTTIILD